MCSAPGLPSAAATRAMAEEIEAQAGWFNTMNSVLRFIVGAMLVQHGDTPAGFMEELDRVGDLFRDAGLRRGRSYEAMAILVLRTQRDLAPVQEEGVARFKEVYEALKDHHWWLTGVDDFPACAILTGRDADPADIARDIEDIYRAIHKEGFWRGNPLQTAANLLYLAGVPSEEVAGRFAALATRFRDAGVSIGQIDYDELAILSFLDHPATVIVDHVLANREVMKTLRPTPDRNATFNLACSITFLELVRLDAEMRTITDAKALIDMQAILNAQAAAAAAVACSVAATTAATAS